MPWEDFVDCLVRKPCTICGACVAIVAVVCFFLCFASLEYTELGLDFSMISNSVDSRGYTAGRYLLGLGHHFVKFPATVQTIQFSAEGDSAGPQVRSRTSDGLEVNLEVSFQYQFNASSIFSLYNKFGTEYLPIFVNIGIDLITTLATSYNASAFFNDRNTISAEMEAELENTFGVQCFAAVPFFQLRSVSLPALFEEAIQETEVKKQDINTAAAEKQNMEVQMMTQVLQAQQQALSIGLQANATAQSTILNVEAYVQQFALSQELQAHSFVPLYQKLGNNESVLLEYLRYRALRDHPEHLSIVSIPIA